ncbi:hypothetical protein [Desulfonatronum parangueonense]
MQLYFTCPVLASGFWSEQWSVGRDLRVEGSAEGERRLSGTVTVPCPYCKAAHTYRPDELPCPLEAAPENGA